MMDDSSEVRCHSAKEKNHFYCQRSWWHYAVENPPQWEIGCTVITRKSQWQTANDVHSRPKFTTTILHQLFSLCQYKKNEREKRVTPLYISSYLLDFTINSGCGKLFLLLLYNTLGRGKPLALNLELCRRTSCKCSAARLTDLAIK